MQLLINHAVASSAVFLLVAAGAIFSIFVLVRMNRLEQVKQIEVPRGWRQYLPFDHLP